ncbi:unnamed protein product [Danaus chrysippus]|uniref:(African queen) hypothetical protein n=1 Tax=Danaus chrysippus TaxID=151541 RepID=A0A8J2QLX6_9NEOP|nr:unnamed protein product [Danaus chrysippus]
MVISPASRSPASRSVFSEGQQIRRLLVKREQTLFMQVLMFSEYLEGLRGLTQYDAHGPEEDWKRLDETEGQQQRATRGEPRV